MYKKSFVYIFIFILSVSIVFGNSNDRLKPEAAVNTVFLESDAKLDHININSYVIINNKFITIDKADKICNDISEKLNMKEVNFQKEKNDNFSQINVSGTISEGLHGTIILQSSKLQDLRESNIVIDVIQTNNQYDLEGLCDKIRNVLSNYGKVNLNITLSGYYDGLIDNKDIKGKITDIFKIVGAKKIEGIDQDELISITGYVPNIKEHMSYCGKKANINIASRFNSYEDRTYIWIGTPLIVLEY